MDTESVELLADLGHHTYFSELFEELAHRFWWYRRW